MIRKSFDVPHSFKNLRDLAAYIGSLESESRVILECTGHYQEPVANTLLSVGLFASIGNSYLIKDFGNNPLREVKSDPC